MRYYDILGYLPAVETFGERDLPSKLSLRLGVRVGKLRRIHETIDRLRRKMLKQHAELDTDGKPIVTENGNYKIDAAAFMEEWNEALETEVEDSLLPALTFADFEGVEEMKPSDVTALITLGLLAEQDG